MNTVKKERVFTNTTYTYGITKDSVCDLAKIKKLKKKNKETNQILCA